MYVRLYNVDVKTASSAGCVVMASLWYGENYSMCNVAVDTASCTHWGVMGIPVKVAIWLFPGDPLNFNGAPGNNHGNFDMYVWGRHGPLPRPALTNFCNIRRQESVPFVSKVHPGSPSRTSVHRLLKQSVQGTRAVCFKNPSRQPVTDVRPQTFETIGARNRCRLFQKSIPAARFTDVRHGPLSRTSETNGAPYARDARARPSTPHTKSPLIMRDIYFAYRRYDKRNLPSQVNICASLDASE